MEGYKAMERAPHGEVRTPTSQWAGLGLSKTSPFALETAAAVNNSTSSGTTPTNSLNYHNSPAQVAATASGKIQWPRTENNASPYGLGTTTGLLDVAPVEKRSQLCQHKDIHSLLTYLGLEHYISKLIVIIGSKKFQI